MIVLANALLLDRRTPTERATAWPRLRPARTDSQAQTIPQQGPASGRTGVCGVLPGFQSVGFAVRFAQTPGLVLFPV